MLLALGTAHAQEPATLATFLEKRVPDELAVEGVMLSRRDLSLKVEQVGEQLLLSLVDLRTGGVVASTKLASVPDDREAAVAAVTHVVADLSRQVGPVAPAPPAQTRVEAVTDQRAELQYREDALRIGERYELDGTPRHPSLVRRWVIYRGEQNHEVDPVDFYNTIGRPDLGKEYEEQLSRRNHAIVAGSVLMAGAAVSLIVGAYESSKSGPTCDVHQTQADFSACVDANIAVADQNSSNMKTALVPAVLFGIAGGISFLVAAHYYYNANPVTEDEAMSLADQYNHGLRHHLGLPSPVVKSLQLAPFSTGSHDGGIAFGGTF